MTPSDRAPFAELLAAVYAFNRVELTKAALGIWWNALRRYDFDAITDAMGRHTMNPDAGQWLPKPADVVRMIEGTTTDSSLAAWTKVERAVRMLGPYQSVCFDDEIVNRVIADMGGWIDLGQCEEREFEFRAKEFQTRYRGLKGHGGAVEHPRSLCGIAEADASRVGIAPPETLLVGDPQAAAHVYRSGGESGSLLVARAVSKVLSNLGVKPNALPAPSKSGTE